VPPTANFDVFGERELAAALWYRQQTSCAGIEFVAITTHGDEAPFQTLSSGMCLVPLQDPERKADAFPRPPYRIYDGWFPVDDDGVEASRAGLRAIEDTLDFYAYQHGIKLRWIVKYTELLGGDLTRGMRSVSAADDTAFRERLSRLLDLPAPLQAAVLLLVSHVLDPLLKCAGRCSRKKYFRSRPRLALAQRSSHRRRHDHRRQRPRSADRVEPAAEIGGALEITGDDHVADRVDRNGGSVIVGATAEADRPARTAGDVEGSGGLDGARSEQT